MQNNGHAEESTDAADSTPAKKAKLDEEVDHFGSFCSSLWIFYSLPMVDLERSMWLTVMEAFFILIVYDARTVISRWSL